ncbi:hypothetical protein ACHAXR_003736 [Thalassiosira sp. AJA248-18]
MAMKRPRKGGKRRQRFDELFEKDLPRSANVICSNSMVNDLADAAKKKLKEYIMERCPGSAEIVDIIFWVAKTQPNELRTKELCETLEAVTLIGASINALLASSDSSDSSSTIDSRRRRETMTIYDLACGHGLGGALLAYRFPEIVRVVCIDMERRPCWITYREAFEKFGIKARKDDTAVMTNLTFQVGDIMATTGDDDDNSIFQPARGDYLMCLHGCNELSPFVLTTALKYGTGFAVMPCCLRDGLLGVSTTSSNNNWGIIDDTARYALQVGYLAGKFNCSKVVAISHFITNRFLIIIGDYWQSNHPHQHHQTTSSA